MKSIQTGLRFKSLTALVAGAMLWTLFFVPGADAQRIGTIDAGTTITVRTNESINASSSDSENKTFSGVVEQDVTNRRGNIAIPKGSDVELVVRKISSTEVALDLDSVMINGQRFGVDTESNVVTGERKDGLGANQRTGKYVGGGAALGAIIGAIAGGGKGAAIGAGAGAAAGAGAQVLTRGHSVKVPAESLLTFRLAQPMRAGTGNGFSSTSNSVRSQENFADNGRGSVFIGSDHNINWQSSDRNATLYVQVDNEAPKLFASGRSGTQAAPWITEGHRYIFVLKDANGNEIARDTQDLRTGRRRQTYSR